MPVLMVATMKGDPDDLAARYERQQKLIYEEFDGTPPGYMAHVCARTDDGLLFANLVDSEERVWETRPRFAETAQEVGLPDPQVDVYPVVNALAEEIAPAHT